MVRVVQGVPAPRRPAHGTWLAIAAMAACACIAAPALAQPQTQSPPEAVQFYRRGRELYQQGRYQEAVVELERALMLDPSSANLVYNCARVYELLGSLDQSLDYYSRYLTMLPPEQSDERARTEGAIRRVRGAQRSLANRLTPPPPPPPGSDIGELRDPNQPFTIRQTGVADAAFWVTAIASSALLVTGAVTGVLALGRANDADSYVLWFPGDDTHRQDLIDEANSLAIATDVLVGIGAVGAVVSGVLYFGREREVEVHPSDTESPTFSFETDGRAAAVSVRGVL